MRRLAVVREDSGSSLVGIVDSFTGPDGKPVYSVANVERVTEMSVDDAAKRAEREGCDRVAIAEARSKRGESPAKEAATEADAIEALMLQQLEARANMPASAGRKR